MPSLYLHIGYPKTGTTSLQTFFAANAEKLKAQGVLYPVTGRLNNAHYSINFSLKIGTPDTALNMEDAGELRKKLKAEVSSSGCSKVLISSEYFITASSVNAIQEYFSDYDTTIIVYLRRHDHAFESSYNQAVRTTTSPPWGPSIESFILYQLGSGTVPYDYLGTLKKWGSVFGDQRIVVRPFERSQNQPDLFSDFLNILGAKPTEDFVRPKAEENSSLSSHIVAAIDAVQRSPVSREIKSSLVGTLIQIDNKLGKRDAIIRLSPALRCALIAKYRQSYGAIAKIFLGRDDRKLFEEAAPKPNEPWEPPIEPSTQEVVDLLLRAVSSHSRGH